jgi:NTE family protein
MLATRTLSLLAALAVALAAQSAAAQEPTAPGPASRPRVGLVLGGGGAMGAAHIGVIKVLEELQVPVDCIAGTSMGALIGGAYASGMRGEELEEFVTSIDWEGVFGSEKVRLYQPMNVKREDETISNKLEFGLGEDGLIAPRGLFDTQQIESLIRNMVSRQSGVTDFDKLPIPFRAVSTDLKSGGMVVFDSGDLPTALRASMSVPGAFPPLEMGDWLLVDGGITRNLPVDVARQSCADVVIAIAVDMPDPPVDSMRSATGSVSRMLDILIEKNEQDSLDSLGPDDVGLDIVLAGVGSTDFHKAAAAIEQGEVAARRATAQLAALAMPADQYAAWQAATRHDGAPTPGRTIEAVVFDGVDPDTADYLRRQVNSKPGEPLDETRIADDALRIYATGQYESVAHSVEGTDPATVIFTPVLKSWGPTFLTFDYGIEASSGRKAEVLVNAKLRRTWPEARGTEWRSLLQLGAENVVETDLRVPLDDARRWFVLPRAGWSSEVEDIFLAGKRIASYEFRKVRGELRLGLEMGSWGEIQTGLYRSVQDTALSIGIPGLPEEKGYDDVGYLFEFERDTRDSDLWATTGSRQRLEVNWADTALGAEQPYQTALFEWNQSAVWRRNVLVFGELSGGTAFGSDPPAQEWFRLGGPGAMSALQRGELRGSDFAHTRLGFGWRISGLDSLLGMTLFAGAALEAGSIWYEGDEAVEGRYGSLLLGSQLFLGGNTPFGPVTLSLGLGEGGDYALYVGIGRPTRGRWR